MATIIDLVTAQSLIKEYQQQNAAPGGPALKTPDDKFHNGYFLDRQSLEDLLSNPNVVGINMIFSKDPNFTGSADNVFALIVAGAEANTSPNPKTPYINTGKIYADYPFCPPWCTNLG